MKTIKTIFVLLALVVVASHSFGQTKEETVKWLTEKMMKESFWRNGLHDSRVVTPTKVIFDDNYLILSVEIPTYSDGSGYASRNSYSINLSNLNTESLVRGYLETHGNHIYKSISGREWITGYTSSIVMSINSSCEPDILARFKKAIEHYISLMTIKKSNEAF